MTLPASLQGRLSLPLIGSPMFIISQPELVIAQCRAGIVGAFLAVPVAATIAVVVRYHAEMAALRSGEVDPSDIDIITGSKDDPEDFSDFTYEHDETPRDKVEQLYQSMSPLS